MTAKSTARNERGDIVKRPGWFSWRHETRAAHDAAMNEWASTKSREAKRAAAAARDLLTRPERRSKKNLPVRVDASHSPAAVQSPDGQPFAKDAATGETR